VCTHGNKSFHSWSVHVLAGVWVKTVNFRPNIRMKKRSLHPCPVPLKQIRIHYKLVPRNISNHFKVRVTNCGKRFSEILVVVKLIMFTFHALNVVWKPAREFLKCKFLYNVCQTDIPTTTTITTKPKTTTLIKSQINITSI